METNVKPLSANSMSVVINTHRYRFEKNEWSKLRNDSDYFNLLSPKPNSTVHVISDSELGDVWLHPARDCVANVINKIGEQVPISFKEGELTGLPRIYGYQLIQHPDLPFAKVRTLLEAKPDVKIALVRELGLGDTLFMTAAVQQLQILYPSATIDIVTKAEHSKLVGGVSLEEALKKAPYDGVWNFTGFFEMSKLRNKYDRVQLFAREVGLEDAWPMKVSISTEDINFGAQHASGAICLSLDGSTKWRSPGEEFKQELSERLDNVVIVGQYKRKFPEHVINLLGDTSVGQLAGVINAARIVVAVDSGPLHIAQALGKPIVALFGPVKDTLRVRESKNVRVVTPEEYHSVTCPCGADLAKKTCGIDINYTPFCFDSFSVDKVMNVLEEMINGGL